MKHKLPKSEILRSKKSIQELFSKDSSSFYLHPFKIVYRDNSPSPDFLPQVLFSVSKKTFKRAIDRNWLKRRMKEAYRLQKHTFYNESFHPRLLAIIYVSKEKHPFAYIEQRLAKVFQEIKNK